MDIGMHGNQRLAAVLVCVALMYLLVPNGAISAPQTLPGAFVKPPSDVITPGVLTYGTAATFPPFEYRDKSGKLTGFDIEMGERLASLMGLRVSVLDMDFDGLIPALKGRRIDIINSAMYIKPEREKQVDFVPYMMIGESIVVLNGNPKGIRRLDDVCGKTVAVTRGAIGEVYMKQQNEVCKSKNLPEVNILALPTNQDAVLAVSHGRADAFDTSIPSAAYLQEQRPGEFQVAVTFNLGTRIGIAVRKGDVEMRRAVEDALKIFVQSGDYDRLMKKYNLPPESSLFRSR